MNLSCGDLVDVYRTPATKDSVGWRGPCEVVNVRNIESGSVDLRWNGRTIAARIPDVRVHIHYSSIYFGFLDTGDRYSGLIKDHLINMTTGCQTLSYVHGPKGFTITNAARQNVELFQALMHLGRNHFGLPRCVGGRVGRGLTSIPGLYGLAHSV